MTPSQISRSFGTLVAAALIVNVPWGAEASRAPSGKVPASSAAQKSGATRSGSAKGPLPDPALLDGSSQAVEKKSEYGMIGDFEMPGDENVKNGKAGGQQNQNPAGGGGQNSNQSMGQPQGGGGGGPQSQQQGGAQGQQGGAQGGSEGQQGGAQGGGQIQQGGGQQGGGGQAGGPENPNAAGNPVGGGGEPGGQPQGIQVAELGGGPSGQQGTAGAGTPGGKPQPVAIGDKAMRIEQTGTPPPGVVGAQKQIADGHVQQHDKGTGTGGKAPTSPQGPGRIEKGRVVPAGL